MKREKKAHIHDREENEWYVEPLWVPQRMVQEEEFIAVHDPCAGMGTVLEACDREGTPATGADLVDRGAGSRVEQIDFLKDRTSRVDILTNPPFKPFREFALHALDVATNKVAMIWIARSLPAAGKWLRHTPLKAVYYCTPRPSMPPGHVFLDLKAQGKEPSGGEMDFVVLVWQHGYDGLPQTKWLHRDNWQERPRRAPRK